MSKPPDIEGQLWVKNNELWVFLGGSWQPLMEPIQGNTLLVAQVVFSPYAYKCFNLGPPPKIQSTYTGECPFETDEQSLAE
jgi:hypothetical protein